MYIDDFITKMFTDFPDIKGMAVVVNKKNGACITITQGDFSPNKSAICKAIKQHKNESGNEKT